MKVAIIYASTTGNTEEIAKTIQGTASGAEVIFETAANADAEKVLGCDLIILGSPAMGAEVLEDSMEEFYSKIEGSISGKNVALFGSYDWGDGQWLRDWETRAKDAGANVKDCLQIHLAPETEDVEKCQSWTKDLLK